MSWMDSWSRPSKQSATPPPLYLTAGDDVPYCHTCGRVISSRKSSRSKGSSTIKYCSDRCRNRKPGPLDKKVEKAIVALLDGHVDSGIERTRAEGRKVKGDRRVIVTMDEIEEVAFGRPKDPEKVYGRNKDRRKRGVPDKGEWRSVDMESSDADGSASAEEAAVQQPQGVHVRPPQTQSEVNFSVGGERGKQERIGEDEEMKGRRDEGQKMAEEREMVRRAARRGIVFGFTVGSLGQGDAVTTGDMKSKGGQVRLPGTGRKCEALMNGSVVEPSFAKGNWALRWRE